MVNKKKVDNFSEILTSCGIFVSDMGNKQDATPPPERPRVDGRERVPMQVPNIGTTVPDLLEAWLPEEQAILDYNYALARKVTMKMVPPDEVERVMRELAPKIRVTYKLYLENIQMDVERIQRHIRCDPRIGLPTYYWDDEDEPEAREAQRYAVTPW